MPSACLEILKRAALIAGAINSAPLKSASFGTFLAETRKVRRVYLYDKFQFEKLPNYGLTSGKVSIISFGGA
jgi:hypothetical protein